ncbi:MAG: EamA family transporter, partial [Proteobacteria bacterium]|nr:EamA family transporter [Pseudomonadota bacterium]
PYTLAHWVWPAGLEWVWLVLVGLLTQAAQVFLTRAYHRERVAEVSHLSYAGAVFAALLGFALFGETIPLPSIVGIVLVIAGALLATHRAPTGRPAGTAFPSPVPNPGQGDGGQTPNRSPRSS